MEEYPMTFGEFINQFLTEEQCEAYLYKLRWEDGFICPKCGNKNYWKTKRLLYICSSCQYQVSVTAGTIFQDTRKPLRSWFTAIWWVTTQKYGASAKGLQQVLGLKSYETAWAWLHKIRKAMVFPNRTKLSGEVEIDECYIGGVAEGGKTGRGSEHKVIVAVATEIKGNKLGRIRLQVIKDASSASFASFITENIERGSKIITDDWKGFSNIEKKGYERKIYKQSTATSEDEMLPHVHLVISLLKRWLLGTHQGAVDPKYLQAYLDEYVFRFNRRKSAKRGLLFYRLLENAIKIEPSTLADIMKMDELESSR
jgi:transposase-like protein